MNLKFKAGLISGGMVVVMSYGCTKTEINTKITPTNSTISFFGGPSGEVLKSFGKTADGGYYFGGYVQSTLNNGAQAFIQKTDSNGHQEWIHYYGGSLDDSFCSVKECSDGGFICSGVTTSFGTGAQRHDNFADCYLLKTDAQGNVQWQKTFGQIYDDYFNYATETTDHGYIATGNIYDIGSGGKYESRVFVVKVDANGNETWKREAFTSIYRSDGEDITEMSNGAFAIGASTIKSGAVADQNSYYPSITFISPNGHLTYGDQIFNNWGIFHFNSAFYPCLKILGVDDGIIMAANLSDQNNAVMLYKIDFSGKLLWNHEYSGIGNAYVYSLSYSNTGNIILTGSTANGNKSTACWLLETNLLGEKVNEISVPVSGYAMAALNVTRTNNQWAFGINLLPLESSHKNFYGLITTDDNGTITERNK